jgi:hypothetical protein
MIPPIASIRRPHETLARFPKGRPNKVSAVATELESLVTRFKVESGKSVESPAPEAPLYFVREPQVAGMTAGH